MLVKIGKMKDMSKINESILYVTKYQDCSKVFLPILRNNLVIMKRIKFSHDRRATTAPRNLRPNHRRLDAVKRSRGMTKNEVSILAPRRQLLIALSANDDRAALVYVC